MGLYKSWAIKNLCDDVVNDVTVDVGQAEIAALVWVGEAFVVDAHEVEEGGMEVVNVDRVLGHIDAIVVGGTIA